MCAATAAAGADTSWENKDKLQRKSINSPLSWKSIFKSTAIIGHVVVIVADAAALVAIAAVIAIIPGVRMMGVPSCEHHV